MNSNISASSILLPQWEDNSSLSIKDNLNNNNLYRRANQSIHSEYHNSPSMNFHNTSQVNENSPISRFKDASALLEPAVSGKPKYLAQQSSNHNTDPLLNDTNSNDHNINKNKSSVSDEQYRRWTSDAFSKVSESIGYIVLYLNRIEDCITKEADLTPKVHFIFLYINYLTDYIIRLLISRVIYPITTKKEIL